jgi:hypothetical protein
MTALVIDFSTFRQCREARRATGQPLRDPAPLSPIQSQPIWAVEMWCRLPSGLVGVIRGFHMYGNDRYAEVMAGSFLHSVKVASLRPTAQGPGAA